MKTSLSVLLLLGICLAGTARAQRQHTVEVTSSGPGAFGRPLTVNIGDQVRWHDNTGAAHNATSDIRGPGFFRENIPANGTSRPVTITAQMFSSGSHAYHCSIHPVMRGTLVLSGTGDTPNNDSGTANTGNTGGSGNNNSGSGTTTGGGDSANPTVKIIVITGSDSTAQLIEDGQAAQQPVSLSIGDTIRWVNRTPEQHLFDQTGLPSGPRALTPTIASGSSADLIFTAQEFQSRGGVAGQPLTITYVSQPFRTVASSLVVTPPPAPAPSGGEHPGGPATAGRGMPKAIGAPLENIALFEEQVVAGNVTNSYYILAADMNNDGKPDLVTSGLGAPDKLAQFDNNELSDTPDSERPRSDFQGTIAWYENPTWKRRVVAVLDVPVPIDVADIDRDGNLDVATSWNYGLCIFGCRPENGITSWLRNPGPLADRPWDRFPVGNLMANHRLFFGNYTQMDHKELLALPVVGGADGNIHAPLKSTVFVPPADPANAREWQAIVANDAYTLVHDASIHKYRAREGSQLDSALIAGGEGVSWLYFDKDGKWRSVHIGEGEQTQDNPSGFTGSGGVAACHRDGDPFAFIASQEPLHGNILAVYTKDTASSLDTVRWKRQIIDTFGPVSGSGEGPLHQVIAMDVDGDGNDEFLVAMRGPLPYQGVYLYKAVDPANGKFTRQRVSMISTARIAVADYDGDGRLDFATAPYDVSTYFDAREPNVLVFYNRTPQATASSAAAPAHDAPRLASGTSK